MSCYERWSETALAEKFVVIIAVANIINKFLNTEHDVIVSNVRRCFLMASTVTHNKIHLVRLYRCWNEHLKSLKIYSSQMTHLSQSLDVLT